MARNQTKALATAAAREKNSRDKAYIILRDLIFKMHSKFKNLPDAVKEDFLENPEFFNVEKLVEFTAAEVGGFERTDLHYSDLSDGTEVKTASVQLKPSSNKSVNSFQGKVTNVGHVSSGSMKKGDLRVVMYVPQAPEGKKLKFFFLPYAFWINKVSRSESNYVVSFSYNKQNDVVPTFAGFEKKNFVELTKLKATRRVRKNT